MIEANYKRKQSIRSREEVGATGIERIAKLINRLVDIQKCDLSPCEHYAFSLLVIDAIPIDFIEVAVRQKPKLCSDGVNVSWQCASGRNDRFILSSVSIRLHGNLNPQESAIDAKKLIEIYQRIHPRHDLKKDLKDWLAFHCPGPIVDYLFGLFNMSSIPDSAYRRLDSQQALFHEALNEDQSLLVQPLAHVFETDKLDASEVFVEGIVKACSRKLGKSDAEAKKLMLKMCEQHSKLLDDYGLASALILSWAIHLIMHGTRIKEALSQSTIANYVGTISRLLFKEIKSIKITEIAEQKYIEIYTRVIDEVSESQKGIAASAISTFHSFLEDWFGVQPIHRNQFHNEIEVAPKSNVVWAHEVLCIKRWLESATADSRLVDSWRLAMLLASHKRFRVGEIFHLRLREITVYPDHAEIHIVSGKTYAAKRTLKIEDRSVLDALHTMVEKRKHDLASPSDFLFGDPAKPNKLYRLGHFYWGLNQLLKIATGDQKISFHSLSDTVISNELITPLSGGDSGFKNDLYQLATNYGHQSITTSCSSYMHLHHIVIRMCMDRALKTVDITSSLAAQWLNKSADALRKQVSLKRLNRNQYFWMSILNLRIDSEKFECCGGEYRTQEPSFPEFLLKRPTIIFKTVLSILRDLAEGMLITSVASRHSVEEMVIQQILNALNHVLSDRRFIAPDYSNNLTKLQTNAQKLKGFGFDFERAEQPKLKQMISFLKNCKSPIDMELKQPILAWMHLCDKRHYQAINTERHTYDLIQLLKRAGVQEQNIAIFVEEGFKGDVSAEKIKQFFLMHYSISPAIFRVKLRRDRPRMYLSISEKFVSLKAEPYGAANCMSGFKAIMLSLAVMLRMESDDA